jgi:hypothetical protein
MDTLPIHTRRAANWRSWELAADGRSTTCAAGLSRALLDSGSIDCGGWPAVNSSCVSSTPECASSHQPRPPRPPPYVMRSGLPSPPSPLASDHAHGVPEPLYSALPHRFQASASFTWQAEGAGDLKHYRLCNSMYRRHTGPYGQRIVPSMVTLCYLVAARRGTSRAAAGTPPWQPRPRSFAAHREPASSVSQPRHAGAVQKPRHDAAEPSDALMERVIATVSRRPRRTDQERETVASVSNAVSRASSSPFTPHTHLDELRHVLLEQVRLRPTHGPSHASKAARALLEVLCFALWTGTLST